MSVRKKSLMIVAAILVAAFSVSGQNNFFGYTRTQSAVVEAHREQLDTALIRTWRGVKRTLIDAYPQTGTTARMVHRPKSNFPDDAVSEGISYGMYLALYMNDQQYFNALLEGGERFMWSEGAALYNWRRDRNGNNNPAMGAFNNGPASDADQDIALLLIFAQRLVDNNIWQAYNPSAAAYPNLARDGYDGRARRILATIRGTMIAQGRYLMPGHWGDGQNAAGTMGTINPGYFAPAFYRIFAEFEPAHAATWNALIEGSYELIALSPGYARGLLPDWVDFMGRTTGGAGYNAYRAGDAMYRDAIRVYWRLGTDYLWYGEPRAKVFLDNAIAFLEGLGGPQFADFFEMNGSLLPERDVEVLAMGHPTREIIRSRREHSHLTMGMWAAAAIGTGNVALAQKYSEHLLTFYEGGDFWGNASAPQTQRIIQNATDVDGVNHGEVIVYEDTLHNEMYFDQFLAWFGASMLNGISTNIWDDLKDGIPIPFEWRSRPTVTTGMLPDNVIDARADPMRLNASINQSTSWIVTLSHVESGASRTFSDRSDTIAVEWRGMSSSGGYMPQGHYVVTVGAGPLSYTTNVWLAMPHSDRPNLITGNRLLVDDFADNDVIPYIGTTWSTHTRADGGIPPGLTSTITQPFPTNGQLTWTYALAGASWRLAALDWNLGSEANFGGGLVDTIIFTAASQRAGLVVSVQLLSNHFAAGEDRYFEHVITLNARDTTVRIPTAETHWVQREHGTGHGKTYAQTLAQVTGIRFHVQYDADHPQAATHGTGSIIMDNMYFAGRTGFAALYTQDSPPANFLDPPEGWHQVVVGVRHRAARNNQYQIRRTANMVRVTLPREMSGADARIVDMRGRTVRRMVVPQNGHLEIQSRNLTAGVYFIDVRKPGASNLRVPLRIMR